MTQDDVLFGYRLRLFSLAAEIGVRRGLPGRWGFTTRPTTAGSPRSSASGLEMLRPRERRAPRMPNQIPAMVEERIVAFSLGHAGLGPKRIAAQLAPPRVGRRSRSPPTASGRCFAATGSTPGKARLALDRRPPRRPMSRPARARARATRRLRAPGRAGRLRLLLRRAPARHPRQRSGSSPPATPSPPSPGPSSSSAPRATPASRRPRRFARRVARELQAAGWRLERVLTDNGNEFSAGRPSASARAKLGAAPDQDPRRPPADQRPRRAPASHDPRGVLAPGLCPLPAGSPHRPAPGARGLPRRIQQPPRAPRQKHQRSASGRPRLRCSQDGAEMSRDRRDISESVQTRWPRRVRRPR